MLQVLGVHSVSGKLAGYRVVSILHPSAMFDGAWPAMKRISDWLPMLHCRYS